MYKDLAEALIKKGLITYNTELRGLARTTSTFNGTSEKIENYVRVNSISKNNTLFNCSDIHGHGAYTMSVNDVDEIEGMDPIRFAECYDMKSDGSHKKPGKKRGRKPKT